MTAFSRYRGSSVLILPECIKMESLVLERQRVIPMHLPWAAGTVTMHSRLAKLLLAKNPPPGKGQIVPTFTALLLHLLLHRGFPPWPSVGTSRSAKSLAAAL